MKPPLFQSDNELMHEMSAWHQSCTTYYFGARYYDPSLGRFLTVDPLEQRALVEKQIARERLKKRLYDLTRHYLLRSLIL